MARKTISKAVRPQLMEGKATLYRWFLTTLAGNFFLAAGVNGTASVRG